MFQLCFPILSTPNLDRLLGFYRDVLGAVETYRFPAEGSPDYVAVDLGSSHLGLGRDPSIVLDAGHRQRIALWIYADDCDAAVDRIRAAGGTVLEEPADQPWGERVARVEDPDGNVLIIGAR